MIDPLSKLWAKDNFSRILLIPERFRARVGDLTDIVFQFARQCCCTSSSSSVSISTSTKATGTPTSTTTTTTSGIDDICCDEIATTIFANFEWRGGLPCSGDPDLGTWELTLVDETELYRAWEGEVDESATGCMSPDTFTVRFECHAKDVASDTCFEQFKLFIDGVEEGQADDCTCNPMYADFDLGQVSDTGCCGSPGAIGVIITD